LSLLSIVGRFGMARGGKVKGAMGTLRKFEALLFSEHTFNEPVQLLSTDEGYMVEGNWCLICVRLRSPT
jgi:hypothetical protein